jgi:uncharacterized protein (TIGR00661 family)
MLPCVALSHQCSLRDRNVPKPSGKDPVGKFILKSYAPSNIRFGLHFNRYSKDIYTPVIRKEIREAPVTESNHYTVYLPSYSAEMLVSLLGSIPETRWQLFSKHNSKPVKHRNVVIKPISNDTFIKSVTSSRGVLCGAGFETPAEVLFLGKKLMVVPMRQQYEQQYNAAALKSLGIPVLRKLKKGSEEKIRDWVMSDFKIEIHYPDITEKIINRIFKMYVDGSMQKKKREKIPGKYKIPGLKT